MIPTKLKIIQTKGIITKTKAFQPSGYLGVRFSHLTISIKVSSKPENKTHTHTRDVIRMFPDWPKRALLQLVKNSSSI